MLTPASSLRPKKIASITHMVLVVPLAVCSTTLYSSSELIYLATGTCSKLLTIVIGLCLIVRNIEEL
jgi:hypothetical protein